MRLGHLSRKVFENGKYHPKNYVFYYTPEYVLSRVLHPPSNRIGLALLRVMRSFGERYLDPFFSILQGGRYNF